MDEIKIHQGFLSIKPKQDTGSDSVNEAAEVKARNLRYGGSGMEIFFCGLYPKCMLMEKEKCPS